jgi:mono/diheme cytochrome c family protein
MSKLRMSCIAALGLATSAALAQAPGSVERGKYLVEGILTCGNCHSPRVAGSPAIDTARLYSGGPQKWDTPEYTVKGSNITPDKETGIGSWRASSIKSAIRDGKRPTGQQLSPQMPYPFYKIFTNEDLDAVVAYLRSLPPVSNKVSAPVYKVPVMHVDIPPGAERSWREHEMKDPVKRGFYLATIGHCMECHTPPVNERRDFKNALGNGGMTFEGPFGASVSRNITSHKEKGIGAWSGDEIKRAITQGVRKDGSKLLPPMGYAWYARMTPADLDAIVAYLRTVPAKE